MASAAEPQQILSDMDVMSMANNKYASGELPLGDNHYVTDAPRKGFIYLCHIMDGLEGGSQINGPWIHTSSWNLINKPAVMGQINWDQAVFSNSVQGETRSLFGNGLPLTHATGNFPIQPSDPVFYYDHNPNHILPQTIHDTLPVHPVYSDTPYCMGAEVGIMLTGVPLFNGFDASMRDAAAHEAQDKCNGHPQREGQYHYHSLSACIKDIGEKTVLGYALDGFPITGPLVAPGRYLTTDDLDVCHGITSEIIEDGQKKVTYHYVMTQDFPYSVSCFRSRPIRVGPAKATLRRNLDDDTSNRGPPQNSFPLGAKPSPPPEALDVCKGQTLGFPCHFMTPRGDTITGSCLTPPGQSFFACIP